MSLNEYVQGTPVEVEFFFQSPSTRERFSPDNITFTYGVGQSMTWTTGGATVPALGVIAEVGVGHFIATIDTSTLMGTISTQAEGTGGVQGIGLHQFIVTPKYY